MKEQLSIKNNLIENGDEMYEMLMNVHDDLDENESHALNARLVLLLINEIGDTNRVKELLTIAKSYCG